MINSALKIANYVLAIVLLLAYLSVYVSPELFWPLAFLGLAFPFLLLANLGFGIYWVVKKRMLFLLSLMVLVIGLKSISKVYQFDFSSPKETKTVTNAEKLTLMSYNVKIFNLVGRNVYGEKQEKLFELIREANPDVICFQEFYVSERKKLLLDTIHKQLPDLPYHHIFWISQESGYKYGIATFSRYPIVRKGRIDFGESLNATIFSDILVDKTRIRIFNNHLQSIRFNKDNYRFISNQNKYTERGRLQEIQDISYRLRDAFIKRSKQAEKISGSIDRSSYPVMVCGDFNDTPISYTYRTISSGLKDAFVEAGRGIGITYKGKFPSYRIDYILYHKGFEIQSFDIIEKRLSDHYPIKATVSIK